ncbi:MAG TPA: ribonuclease domain-containing protein [Alphaproteobacteria bacterium]|nr:ribonuclease domain-containing protein [Alphaproteobacteria bacterium]
MRTCAALFRSVLFACTLASALPGGLGAATAANVCGLSAAPAGPQDQALRNFAHDLGLRQIEAFVGVANYVHNTGRLPACYLTKAAAEAKGWHPGSDLWKTAPSTAIGGDAFYNRGRRLPAKYDGRYREADLDYAGGKRGAHRLIYVSGGAGTWLQWVTVDHYRHFFKLPEAE